MQLLSSFILLAASASTTLAWSHLFERAPPGCLADNCLRAITGTEPGQTQTRVDRAADCSNIFVQTVTPVTVTVTATASVTSSVTSLFTTTTTTAAQANGNAKRTALASSSIPAYASPCSSVARYSSACSCAGWLPSTVTAVVPTITSTISTTLTTFIDITSTSTIVSSATLVGPAACTSQTVSIGYNNVFTVYYEQIFVGTGVSENPDNPSNQGYGSVTTTLPGSMDACDAVVACASWGLNTDLGTYNIDLHFALTEQEWVCVGYDLGESSASDYDIVNSDIGTSMGYNLFDIEQSW